MQSVLDFLRSRMHMAGFDYPVMIPLVADFGMVVAGVTALIQRDAFFPPGWEWLCMLAMLALTVLHIGFGYFVNRFVYAAVMIAAAIPLMMQGVSLDSAPILLALAAAEVGATASLRVSIPASLLMVAAVIPPALAGRLDGALVYGGMIAVGWMVGYMLLTQAKLLEQERETRSAESARAAVRERQRIAREVHDVIAHSLSVTLLHLTGARRALEEDRDIDEAIDAMVDAEKLGRQAMADIRRTVGLLDAGSSGMRPEPAMADIPDLVDDFRRAGLPVAFAVEGDLTSVNGATGLGIYRIAQESLANIAKHAPGASADVRVEVTKQAVNMHITNSTDARKPVAAHAGSGLRGMRDRAAMLGGQVEAGPNDKGWSVRAAVPLAEISCPAPFLKRIVGMA